MLFDIPRLETRGLVKSPVYYCILLNLFYYVKIYSVLPEDKNTREEGKSLSEKPSSPVKNVRTK